MLKTHFILRGPIFKKEHRRRFKPRRCFNCKPLFFFFFQRILRVVNRIPNGAANAHHCAV